MHRNKYLHDTCNSASTTEQTAINEEIEFEYNIGISTLAVRHRHLFQVPLQAKLCISYHSKRVWLANVWSAREMDNENYLRNNPSNATTNTIRFRYDQWKKHTKRRQAMT